MRRLLPILIPVLIAFGAGVQTHAFLRPANAAFANRPHVYHIVPSDVYPKLAPGINGKMLGHVPGGDIEVIDIMNATPHIHAHIDEVVYVISGHGTGTIGASAYTFSPGDVVVLPRGVAHSLKASGGTPVRLLGIAYPKDLPSDMKPAK
ncbi:MAG: hypothetical protein NVS1B14_00510 [Vulcanimicrobiaceae bacterium]